MVSTKNHKRLDWRGVVVRIAFITASLCFFSAPEYLLAGAQLAFGVFQAMEAAVTSVIAFVARGIVILATLVVVPAEYMAPLLWEGVHNIGNFAKERVDAADEKEGKYFILGVMLSLIAIAVQRSR